MGIFNKALWMSRLKLLKRIFNRKLASERHKKVWVKFENTVLYYRSNSIFLFHIVHFLMFLISGNGAYNSSKEYLESS